MAKEADPCISNATLMWSRARILRSEPDAALHRVGQPHCRWILFQFALRVAIAHGRYGVQLPATTGHPDFERVYRVHINTLEWMPTFLVPLWLTATYLNDRAAALAGLVWIVGRVWYAVGYSRATQKRLPGFFVQAGACIVLFIGSLIGIGMRIASAWSLSI
jgi:glutathione S-transferase